MLELIQIGGFWLAVNDFIISQLEKKVLKVISTILVICGVSIKVWNSQRSKIWCMLIQRTDLVQCWFNVESETTTDIISSAFQRWMSVKYRYSHIMRMIIKTLYLLLWLVLGVNCQSMILTVTFVICKLLYYTHKSLVCTECCTW